MKKAREFEELNLLWIVPLISQYRLPNKEWVEEIDLRQFPAASM